MLRIRAIKIDVLTTHGRFGAEHFFTNGLNIVRGDNSSGKSTLFQAILFGLGLEELLGGKNAKAMQSVLRDQVESPTGEYFDVLQADIYLEIENKRVITTRRSVKSADRSEQLVDVFYGPLLTEPESYESRPMYVHDKGSASDELFGFHQFLADFLGWELPDVVTFDGDLRKLYVQQIAPAFIVEQKAGWSDFFASAPRYSTKFLTARIVEFILRLSVFENQRRRQELISKRQILKTKWADLYQRFDRLADSVRGSLTGIDEDISILAKDPQLALLVPFKDEMIPLDGFNDRLKDQLRDAMTAGVATVGVRKGETEQTLRELMKLLNHVSINYDLLVPEVGFDEQKLHEYEEQRDVVLEDLRKNKGALKIQTLGAILPSKIATHICPTCNQRIHDALLPEDAQITPLGLEENIQFLESHEKMISVYIDGQRKLIDRKKKRLNQLEADLGDIRQRIRDAKQELTQNENLPSAVQIRSQIELKSNIDRNQRTLNEFAFLTDALRKLSADYVQFLVSQKELPTDIYSASDRDKLDALQDRLRSLLHDFNYQSKSSDDIEISDNNYLPVIRKEVETGIQKQWDIIFDSSASDFIRCMWAFMLALMDVGIAFPTNHPGLLILDEPKQQDISLEDFRHFLEALSKYSGQQIIVFASFENDLNVFRRTTEGLAFSLNEIDPRLIQLVDATADI